eukprot:Opistho-1_new@63349
MPADYPASAPVDIDPHSLAPCRAETSRRQTRETVMLSSMQKQWFGHGVLMILATLLGGVGLWMFLVGGFEIVPGYILHFQLPGSAEGWRRAHAGPALNGLMVIAVALVLPALN